MPSIDNVKKAIAAVDANPETKELIVTFGSKKVQRGEYLPRADAQTTPTYAWSGAVPGKTYLVLALDLDAPFPSLPVLGPILHGIQPGLKLSGTSSDLSSEVPAIAGYIAPAPPPLSGPHRYVFLLYEQPAAFDGKKVFPGKEGQQLPVSQRIRFNPDNFVKEAGLGDVLAGGWFESN